MANAATQGVSPAHHSHLPIPQCHKSTVLGTVDSVPLSDKLGVLPLSSLRLPFEELVLKLFRVRAGSDIFQSAQIHRLRCLGSSVRIALPEELPEFFHQNIPETLFLVHDAQEHMVFHGIKSVSLVEVDILLPLGVVRFLVLGNASRAQPVPDVVANGEVSCK